MPVWVEVENMERVQRVMVRYIEALRPSGAMGRAVQKATLVLHRYALTVTPVDTGTLRASHTMKVAGNRGEIFINPANVNPKSRTRAAVYGPKVHAEAPHRAFYARTVKEAGQSAGQAAQAEILGSLRGISA